MNQMWIRKLIEEGKRCPEGPVEGLVRAYYKLEEVWAEQLNDKEAWNAPSECLNLILRGQKKEDTYFWELVGDLHDEVLGRILTVENELYEDVLTQYDGDIEKLMDDTEKLQKE